MEFQTRRHLSCQATPFDKKVPRHPNRRGQQASLQAPRRKAGNECTTAVCKPNVQKSHIANIGRLHSLAVMQELLCTCHTNSRYPLFCTPALVPETARTPIASSDNSRDHSCRSSATNQPKDRDG